MQRPRLHRAAGRSAAGRTAAWTCVALACAFPPAHAAAPPVSSAHSTVRLVDGGSAEDAAAALRGGPLAPGSRLAGVEITLDPGFITYWRSAGEAGVPPVFDFSGSANLKEAKVEYPAPRLIDEEGTQAYGYSGGVTFPLVVLPLDAKIPVTLDLALDYAVCARLCLPAKAHLSLTIDGSGPAETQAVRDALARVPVAGSIGQTGPVSIDAVKRTGPNRLVVDAKTPDGTGTLFVEAPDPWYFSSGPARPGAGGRLSFVVTGPDRAPSGPRPKDPLRLTLVSPAGSIEVPVPLDAADGKP